MEYLRLWGILSFITGIALLFHTIRKRKSIGLILYVTYLIFAITCVCLGIYCIIRNQYDELCAIIFGIAFTVFTYKLESSSVSIKENIICMHNNKELKSQTKVGRSRSSM